MEATTQRERLMMTVRTPIVDEGTSGARGKILLPSAKAETDVRTMRCRVTMPMRQTREHFRIR